MPRPEEPKKQLAILDLWAIRRHIFTVILVSIPAFAIYCGILLMLNPVSGTLEGALILIVVEAAVGLTTTRKYSDFGAATRARLHFLDPSTLGSSWRESVLETRREEIALLFERAYTETAKHSNIKTDDLNDVSWFAVLAYSVTSVGIAVATSPNILLVLGAAALLLLLCAMCYGNGYASFHIRLLDEDLDHLENHVMTRLSALDSVAGNGRSCVRWLEKRKLRVVSDIGLSVDLADTNVTYWVGIASLERERFELTGRSDSASNVLKKVSGLPIVTQSNWQLLDRKAQSGFAIRVYNPIKTVRISSEYSVVLSPTSASAASSALSETMSMLLDLLAI
jgi:hypothetical protein